jgi:hypothetical protein
MAGRADAKEMDVDGKPTHCSPLGAADCGRVTAHPEVDLRHGFAIDITSRLPTIHARSAHIGLVAVSLRVQQTAADSHPDP